MMENGGIQSDHTDDTDSDCNNQTEKERKFLFK